MADVETRKARRESLLEDEFPRALAAALRSEGPCAMCKGGTVAIAVGHCAECLGTQRGPVHFRADHAAFAGVKWVQDLASCPPPLQRGLRSFVSGLELPSTCHPHPETGVTQHRYPCWMSAKHLKWEQWFRGLNRWGEDETLYPALVVAEAVLEEWPAHHPCVDSMSCCREPREAVEALRRYWDESQKGGSVPPEFMSECYKTTTHPRGLVCEDWIPSPPYGTSKHVTEIGTARRLVLRTAERRGKLHPWLDVDEVTRTAARERALELLREVV